MTPDFVGEDRVEIDLAYLREVGRKLRQLDQEQRDGLFVRRRHVAIGLEDARDARASDEAAGEIEIERRQRQRLVADHFDRGAALTEDDDGTEGRIVGHPDDEFARLGPHDHRKNRDAGDTGVRFGLARAF